MVQLGTWDKLPDVERNIMDCKEEGVMMDRSLAIAARVKGRNAFVDSWAVGKLYTHISHINSTPQGVS